MIIIFSDFYSFMLITCGDVCEVEHITKKRLTFHIRIFTKLYWVLQMNTGLVQKLHNLWLDQVRSDCQLKIKAFLWCLCACLPIIGCHRENISVQNSAEQRIPYYGIRNAQAFIRIGKSFGLNHNTIWINKWILLLC